MKRSTTARPARTTTALAGTVVLAAGLALGGATLTSDAFASPGNGSSVGTAQIADLMSPMDFSDALAVRTVTSRMGPQQHAAVSGCTGEQELAHFLPPAARVLVGGYHGRTDGHRVEADEVIGDHAGLSDYRSIVHELRGCQHEPATHWHYGALHRDNNTRSRAAWMVTYDGGGQRDGGVVAAYANHHVAITEVTGRPVSGRDLEMVATDVSLRLR